VYKKVIPIKYAKKEVKNIREKNDKKNDYN